MSVVIPTWNGLAYLRDCLMALAEQHQAPAEIVIVDNGSTDGTVAYLQTYAPSARLVVNDRNLGFARASNQGILAARGDLIVMLNNDTMPAPGCLAALTAALEGQPRVGACAATQVFAHAPEVVNSAGLTVGQDLVALDGHLGQAVADLPTAPWPVFGVSAGAAIYRRAALDDVGLFDERFFAYLEDVDLAWRLRLRGWQALATPDALVRHVYSATAGGDSSFKRYHLARNRVWLLLKNVPARLWRRQAVAVLWYDSVALLAALAKRDRAWLLGRREGLRQAPRLWGERRSIQERALTTPDEIAASLGPRVGPLNVWRARRRSASHGQTRRT